VNVAILDKWSMGLCWWYEQYSCVIVLVLVLCMYL